MVFKQPVSPVPPKSFQVSKQLDDAVQKRKRRQYEHVSGFLSSISTDLDGCPICNKGGLCPKHHAICLNRLTNVVDFIPAKFESFIKQYPLCKSCRSGFDSEEEYELCICCLSSLPMLRNFPLDLDDRQLSVTEPDLYQKLTTKDKVFDHIKACLHSNDRKVKKEMENILASGDFTREDYRNMGMGSGRITKMKNKSKGIEKPIAERYLRIMRYCEKVCPVTTDTNVNRMFVRTKDPQQIENCKQAGIELLPHKTKKRKRNTHKKSRQFYPTSLMSMYLDYKSETISEGMVPVSYEIFKKWIPFFCVQPTKKDMLACVCDCCWNFDAACECILPRLTPESKIKMQDKNARASDLMAVLISDVFISEKSPLIVRMFEKTENDGSVLTTKKFTDILDIVDYFQKILDSYLPHREICRQFYGSFIKYLSFDFKVSKVFEKNS